MHLLVLSIVLLLRNFLYTAFSYTFPREKPIYSDMELPGICPVDPDMLEVGNGGMSVEEYRSHFSIWALAKVCKCWDQLSH